MVLVDPIIKARCLSTVTIYPYIGMDNGDKVFGEPYSLKAYVNYRQKIMLENEGTIYENYTYIILDGKDVQFNTIHNEDEIVLPQQPRVPIKSVKTYQGLPDGTQNVELIV